MLQFTQLLGVVSRGSWRLTAHPSQPLVHMQSFPHVCVFFPQYWEQSVFANRVFFVCAVCKETTEGAAVRYCSRFSITGLRARETGGGGDFFDTSQAEHFVTAKGLTENSGSSTLVYTTGLLPCTFWWLLNHYYMEITVGFHSLTTNNHPPNVNLASYV